MSTRIAACAVFGVLAVMGTGAVNAHDSSGKAPAAQVVWQIVGRTLLDFSTGNGQVLAYFTFLEGAAEPMFAGPPGEATAHFTLRSRPFQARFFPNNDVLIGLLGDETFTLYVDETPDQDFANPESFSDGQPLASFNRLPAQIHFVGPVFTDTFSVEPIWSRPVPWQGRPLDLRRVTPAGVTLAITGSTQALPSGVDGFPAAVAFGASAIAIGR